MGKLSVWLYEKLYHRTAPDYVASYSLGTLAMKPVRKWLVNTVAANCPFNSVRVGIYRMCGFRIGRHTSIGMKCYLDDHCTELMTIEDNVTVSYGVFFACHGKNQPHTPIVIREGAYIGMRASIVSGKRGVTIGKDAVVGACALVLSDVPDGATVVGVPARISCRGEE